MFNNFRKNENGSPALETLLLFSLLFIFVFMLGKTFINRERKLVQIETAIKITQDRNAYCNTVICRWEGTVPIYCDKWNGYYSKNGSLLDYKKSAKYISGYKPICVISEEYRGEE